MSNVIEMQFRDAEGPEPTGTPVTTPILKAMYLLFIRLSQCEYELTEQELEAFQAGLQAAKDVEGDPNQ